MARKRNLPRTVEAQQLILRTKTGGARALLTIQDAAPAFKLLDSFGMPRVEILLDRLERLLVRLEVREGAHLGISSDDQGSIGFGISRKGGVPVFEVGCVPPFREDKLRVVVYDAIGNPVFWSYAYGPAFPLSASDSGEVI